MVLDISPKVLDQALKALWARYPGIRDRMANEQGEIRQHISVFVGREDIRYTGGLATPTADGCEISIVPAVSGGKFFCAPASDRRGLLNTPLQAPWACNGHSSGLTRKRRLTGRATAQARDEGPIWLFRCRWANWLLPQFLYGRSGGA